MAQFRNALFRAELFTGFSKRVSSRSLVSFCHGWSSNFFWQTVRQKRVCFPEQQHLRTSETVRFAHSQQAERKTESSAAVISVDDIKDKRMLQLHWNNGEKMLFPYIFLRDSCQCESCFHPFTKARLILMRDLKTESFPINVQTDDNQHLLLVTWDDGHVSPFPYKWLRDHSFAKEAVQKQDNLYCRKPTPWGKDFQDNYPTADFNQLLTDDKILYQYLTNLEEFGFCLIKNAPTQPGELEKLANHISFNRTTSYGPTFNVVANPLPSNLAYTTGTLGLHTDIPYDRYPPGVQFLHCIKQTTCKGGENQFSDSFYTASILKEQFPEYYRLLCTVPINFIDVGTDHFGEFYKLGRHPTFSTDTEGSITAIQCANQTRDSYMKLPVEKVETMIRALRKLDDVLYENHIKIKMADGDIASFGNRRVLHGRDSYSVEAGSVNQRRLQGIYIDLDEINSKRRLLKLKLNIDKYEF